MEICEHAASSEKIFGHKYLYIHWYLDRYAGRKGRDLEGNFDFTGSRKIRHREKRHHYDGLQRIREIFGEEAFEAAKQHYFEDFAKHPEYKNYILSRDDYHTIGFWNG